MVSKEIGILGENLAVEFLEEKGYQILDKNYRFEIFGPQKGEIDIVAKKNGIISFVEVKTLTSDKNFSPEAKVDFSKQRKIVKSAQSWLMKNKIPLDAQWQIDVVAIIIDENPPAGGQKASIRHLQNAVF